MMLIHFFCLYLTFYLLFSPPKIVTIQHRYRSVKLYALAPLEYVPLIEVTLGIWVESGILKVSK